MPRALGIDIGGTGSRWVALDAKGAVAGRGVAPGATGHVFNPEMRAQLKDVIESIAKDVRVDAVHAGITGLGEPVARDVRHLIAEAFGCVPQRVTVSDDMELAFKARFAPGGGHLVSAGTGAFGLHIDAKGERVRVGGRGILIDDAGSGAWIALRALDRLYRRIDEMGGPGDAAILGEALFGAIGGSDWESVRTYIYAGDRGRIGTLARAVAQAALAGDRTAQDLIAAAGRELARLAKILIDRCGVAPVDFVGGVLDLHPGIGDAIASALPGVQIGFPTIDAALAAAHIAHKPHGLLQ